MYPINPYIGLKIITDSLLVQLSADDYISGTSWAYKNLLNYSAKLSGNPGYTDLSYGSYLDFDGVDDFAYLDQTNLNFTTGDFSICMWVRLNSLSTNQSGQGPCLFYKGYYRASGYYLSVNTAGGLSFVTNQAGANQVSASNTGVIGINNWYFIAVTRQGNSVRLYVNGTDVTSTAGSHVNPALATADPKIGLYDQSSSYKIYARIKLGYFIAYSKKLSAIEVNQNFNATKGLYL